MIPPSSLSDEALKAVFSTMTPEQLREALDAVDRLIAQQQAQTSRFRPPLRPPPRPERN